MAFHIFGGGYPHIPPEQLGIVTGALKAGAHGNLRNVVIGIHQQLQGAADSVVHQKLNGGLSGGFSEFSAQLLTTQPTASGNVA